MKKILFCSFYLLGIIFSLQAQSTEPLLDKRILTLQQVVELAKTQSPAYKQAKTALKTNYWVYRTFRSAYLPQLLLKGTLPNLNRDITGITQDDGSIKFQRQSLATSSVGLTLSQNIGLTGGSIFLDSSTERLDLFETDKSTSYQAVPVSIGFRQPIFQFNRLQWNRKVEPLKYEESIRQFNEDLEKIGVQATDIFFNVLLAQISLQIATKNQANTDTLYKIAQGRYELGKIAENDLLQLELSLLNAGLAVTKATLDLENNTLELKSFLGITDNATVELVEPSFIPPFEIDAHVALKEARKNRRSVVGFQRQLLEAEMDVARARGETGLNVDMFASVGLVQSAPTIPQLYLDPNQQRGRQYIRIGVEIPILDWGRSKAIVQTALSNQELVQANIAQNELDFNRQIALQVNQFKMIRDQLIVAIKTDEIAQKRYEITKNRYVIGKIGITDLNIALQEKDQAKQAYVNALRAFWNGYYNLRLLTLYDFESKQPINYH